MRRSGFSGAILREISDMASQYGTLGDACIYTGDERFATLGKIPWAAARSYGELDKEKVAMSETKGNGFSWFLAGLGIGSLLGVLYAPKSGQETRDELVAGALGKTEYLKQRSREVGSQVGEYVERGKGQVNEYVEKGKVQVGEYVEKGKGYVDLGRGKINDAVNQGRNLVNEHTVKAQAAYEAGKQAYVETTAEPVAPVGAK
jgi:gas vesicle protein